MFLAIWPMWTAAWALTDDAVIQARVSEKYGKPVPLAAVCIERPGLPPEFGDDLAVVGVTRTTVGCRLFGVMVRGTWFDAAEALPVALGQAAWDGAPPEQQAAWLVTWTDRVLLAFDQLDPMAETAAGSVPPSPTPRTPPAAAPPAPVPTHRVTARFVQRAEIGDHRHLTRETVGTFDFSATGLLLAASREAGPVLQTRFTVQELPGSAVSGDRVHAELQQRGKRVADCWEEAFARDLRLDGRIVLRWNFRGGVAGGVAFVDEGTAVDEKLARCYSAALTARPFSADLDGTVTWSFRVFREPFAEAAASASTPEQ